MRISRPDISRAETLFLPVGIMTTVGEVKAMMPGRAVLLGRQPELWLRPEERRAGGPSSAPLHGPAQRLCEFRADGSARADHVTGVVSCVTAIPARVDGASSEQPERRESGARFAANARAHDAILCT